ncbi:MAG: response regulator [Thermoplasmata archaeon]
MRLLVVDDDSVFRDEFATLLRDEGHHAEAAASVPKAIEALEHEEFDVVFTDLKMPRHGGLELVQILKERWPLTYVVVVTGYASVPTAVESMKTGAFDYIEKPFRMEQVRRVLELADQERRFSEEITNSRDPLRLASSFRIAEGRTVLLVGDQEHRPHEGIEFATLDPESPNRLADLLDAYLADHPKPAFILTGIEKIFGHLSTEDTLNLLRQLRDKMDGKGPLAIGFDPLHVTEVQAELVRGVVAAPGVHGAFEALASPIRRRILRRLEEGPTTFGEAMHAAGIDDSPKMAFHLHRLIDEGLVSRHDEEYRLTSKGRGAVEVLHRMEKVAAGTPVGNLVFPTGIRRPAPPSAP